MSGQSRRKFDPLFEVASEEEADDVAGPIPINLVDCGLEELVSALLAGQPVASRRLARSRLSLGRTMRGGFSPTTPDTAISGRAPRPCRPARSRTY